MTYIYYNGGEWVEVSEKIGGNEEDWYNVYEDRVTGNKFRQHKFEYPTILTNYLEPFALHNSDTELTSRMELLSTANIPWTESQWNVHLMSYHYIVSSDQLRNYCVSLHGCNITNLALIKQYITNNPGSGIIKSADPNTCTFCK
jgi:hypothetical protein